METTIVKKASEVTPDFVSAGEELKSNRHK